MKPCHREKLRSIYYFGLSQLNTQYSTFFLKLLFCYVIILEGFGSHLAFKKFGFGVWLSNYFNM